MRNKKENICPRCGLRYSERPALSRADNKTNICPAEHVKAWKPLVWIKENRNR